MRECETTLPWVLLMSNLGSVARGGAETCASPGGAAPAEAPAGALLRECQQADRAGAPAVEQASERGIHVACEMGRAAAAAAQARHRGLPDRRGDAEAARNFAAPAGRGRSQEAQCTRLLTVVRPASEIDSTRRRRPSKERPATPSKTAVRSRPIRPPVDAQSPAMPTHKTTKTTAAASDDGRGARRLTGGASKGAKHVARHARAGARAAGDRDPRHQAQVARPEPRSGGTAVAPDSSDRKAPPGGGQRIGYARVFDVRA
jgi:hypothetical protein